MFQLISISNWVAVAFICYGDKWTDSCKGKILNLTAWPHWRNFLILSTRIVLYYLFSWFHLDYVWFISLGLAVSILYTGLPWWIIFMCMTLTLSRCWRPSIVVLWHKLSSIYFWWKFLVDNDLLHRFRSKSALSSEREEIRKRRGSRLLLQRLWTCKCLVEFVFDR